MEASKCPRKYLSFYCDYDGNPNAAIKYEDEEGITLEYFDPLDLDENTVTCLIVEDIFIEVLPEDTIETVKSKIAFAVEPFSQIDYINGCYDSSLINTSHPAFVLKPERSEF